MEILNMNTHTYILAMLAGVVENHNCFFAER